MSFFPDVQKIRYEGPTSTDPLSFRHYNADEVVEGKKMRDHFRFAVAYWHTPLSIALYVLVALIWLVPDSRIESILRETEAVRE